MGSAGTEAKYVSHVLYRTWDRERAFAFFVDVLGFYPQRRGRIIYAGKGDTLVEFPPERPELQGTAESDPYALGVAVEDLEACIAEYEKHGCKVTRPHTIVPTSFWGRQAVITVPGGQPIALREWRAPDGPHFTGWTPDPPPEA